MLVGSALGLALQQWALWGGSNSLVSKPGNRHPRHKQRPNFLALVKSKVDMSVIGTAIGVAIASFIIRALHSILYGVQSTDMVTLAIVSTLLLLVAFTATCIPALRATRVDPVVALRGE
jgi:hypothetical protein